MSIDTAYKYPDFPTWYKDNQLSNGPLPFTIKYSQPFWEKVAYKKNYE